MISRCKQPQEAAAEAEPQRCRSLHLEGEARIVEAQPSHRLAQIAEISGVDREQPAEHDGLRRLEARQRRSRGLALVGDGVADARVGHLLDGGGEETDLARPQRVEHLLLGTEHADALDLVAGVSRHQRDPLALAQHAFDDAHEHDDAEIGIIPAVDQQRFERLCGIALGRRQPLDDRLQHRLHVETRLGGNRDRVRGIEPDHVLDLLLDAVGVGGRQIDLVEHGQDLEVVVERLVDVGERLRLHALARVDDEDRALAGGEAARYLVGEVDVARRVHQVELIGLAVLGLVIEAHGLRLDGDAALALDVHRIEHLLLHLARRGAAAQLDKPVRQRRFSVVDVGDDGEVANKGGVGHGRLDSTRPAHPKGASTRWSSCRRRGARLAWSQARGPRSGVTAPPREPGPGRHFSPGAPLPFQAPRSCRGRAERGWRARTHSGAGPRGAAPAAPT